MQGPRCTLTTDSTSSPPSKRIKAVNTFGQIWIPRYTIRVYETSCQRMGRPIPRFEVGCPIYYTASHNHWPRLYCSRQDLPMIRGSTRDPSTALYKTQSNKYQQYLCTRLLERDIVVRITTAWRWHTSYLCLCVRYSVLRDSDDGRFTIQATMHSRDVCAGPFLLHRLHSPSLFTISFCFPLRHTKGASYFCSNFWPSTAKHRQEKDKIKCGEERARVIAYTNY